MACLETVTHTRVSRSIAIYNVFTLFGDSLTRFVKRGMSSPTGQSLKKKKDKGE